MKSLFRFCTAGILSSSKSPLCDDFRASSTNCYCDDWVLHVVLPLTSCDFCSQILSVYERSIEVFFFFFWLFLLRMRGNLLIYPKISISRLLWGDRWKLHGEIQRQSAIVTTYMFMTNDRCDDSFVQISRLQHILNNIQV